MPPRTRAPSSLLSGPRSDAERDDDVVQRDKIRAAWATAGAPFVRLVKGTAYIKM